ncbi:hypothetical protein HDV00_004012 [Rhizophlyctis rosea]|nr:hypothetical protein HDV00_004012 [Rhizophlyctis rosea]
MTASNETILSSQTVRHVLEAVQQQPLVSISADDKVEKAFELLLEHDLEALPVFSIDANGRREYISIINVFDLIVYTTLQHVFEMPDLSNVDSTAVAERAEFLTHPVREVIGLSEESSVLHMVKKDEHVSRLISTLSHGVHHVLVEPDTSDTEPHIIAQTDLLKYLFSHNESLETTLNISAGEVISRMLRKVRASSQQENLDIHTHPPIPIPHQTLTIGLQDSALLGFKKMKEHHVTSVGVVDRGALVSALSAANLRGLTRDRVHEVLKPVLVFLRNSQGEIPEPHICTPRFTLSQVIANMIRLKHHRLFVVDEDQVPVGVISMSDVISMFTTTGAA